MNKKYQSVKVGKDLHQLKSVSKQPSIKSVAEHSNSFCPDCGQKVAPGADICEHCKSWQLNGQCVFCYTAVDPDQRFCSECGNNPRSVTCKSCGEESIFDFCSRCDAPVSRDAQMAIVRLRESVEFTEIAALDLIIASQPDCSPVSENKQVVVQPEDWLNQLQEYIKTFQQQTSESSVELQGEPKPKVGFGFSSENTDVSDALKKAGQAKESITSGVSPQQDRDILRDKIAQRQRRKFADNQAARKFYTSVKILLPTLALTKDRQVTGWICNYTETVHRGPDDCACPSLGGEWIYEENLIYKTDFTEY